jgi:2,4-dienoyl-CoA reductase (NADPH2)
MFDALFQSGRIGSLALKNRLIMAAMGNALAAGDGSVSEALLNYYRPRAKGGVGLVISQFASVSPDAVMPYNLRLDDDRFTPGMARLVGTLHQGGAKAAVQLMHPGMLLVLLKSLTADQEIKVPSVSALLPPERKYHELTSEEIEALIDYFVVAAGRVKASGADALELHACHGCLLSTFLSPAVNRRSDLYGGSAENRARLVSRIIAGIKERLGAEYPLIVRLNGDDDIPGGVTPEDVAAYAGIFSRAGADAISISSGMEYWSTLMAPTHLTAPGPVIGVAEVVKQKVGASVIVAGKIPPALGDKSIAAGRADFVALGRPLLADPELPDKLQQNRLSEVAWCLYCNNCMRTSWTSCTVNPGLFREGMFQFRPAAAPKQVLVAGGGLAGMKAALLFRQKGHEVALYEKEPLLGGQWRIACLLAGRAGQASIINFLKRELGNSGVKINLGMAVDRAVVEAAKAEIVILATGAAPAAPALPGSPGFKIVQAVDLIAGQGMVEGKVVVLGSTLLALETALWLAEKDNAVSLVCPGPFGGRKGPDDMISFRALLRGLAERRVPVYANAAVLSSSGSSLLVRWGEENLPLPCDSLVLAAGMRAYDPLSAELKGLAAEVYAIGDCVAPGNAAQAIFSAARLAQKL